jgi:hypothetical protein
MVLPLDIGKGLYQRTSNPLYLLDVEIISSQH